MQIRADDLAGPGIAAFLEEHLRDMRAASPPHSVHALDLDGLRKPEVTFWVVWDDDQIAGCGALKELDAAHGEVKSMRTGASSRRRGVGSLMLRHIIDVARARGYRRLSLETGSMAFFHSAHALYLRHGFVDCEPFGSYKPDPNSRFLTLQL